MTMADPGLPSRLPTHHSNSEYKYRSECDDCKHPRSSNQFTCECWTCRQCGRRYSCSPSPTSTGIFVKELDYTFVPDNLQEETVVLYMDHVILEGYKAFDNDVEYKDNPYPTTQKIHFIYWNYGWLQAYYQDNEGIGTVRK